MGSRKPRRQKTTPQTSRPDGAVDRREHAEHEGKPGDERDLEEHEVRRVPGLGRGEHALLGFVAGHGECVGHDLAGVLALVLDLARAEGGELAAGLKLEADGRERVAREALHAVHDDREDGCGGKTGVKRGLLHHRGGHDAARERRDAGDDERAVHEERTDEPAQAHEPGEARNTDDHGLPLLEQALETEERAHVGDEEEDGDGGAQRQKLRVRNERLWEEGPEGDEDQHGGDEDRRNPAFRELGEHLAQQDDDEAGRKGRDKVVHEHGLVP